MDALFDEYLRLREEGDPEAASKVLARAGADRAELAERIALHESLEGLGQAVNAAPEASPSTFGRFEIKRTLAEGGMSRVFLARDPQLGREVAVKVLSSFAAGETEGRAMLVNEARALAHLHHPGVVQVYEVDEHAGAAFLAMERIDGPSLADVLAAWRDEDGGDEGEREEPDAVRAAVRALQPVEARCRLVRDLARALDYCHARGVIHRDVKPGNVLLSGDATPVLIDFGLATVLGEGHTTTNLTQGFVGTPAYISPEQVNDRRTGASALSDQFSLGIVLYQLLTLENPFHGGGREATLDAIARADPPRPRERAPAIPADLELVTMHCLEKVPQDRYASVGALADDLEAFLEGRAISVASPSPLATARRWLRRHRREVSVAGAAAAVALGTLAVAWGAALRGDAARLDGELARLRARVDERPAVESPATWDRTVRDLGALADLADANREARRGWLARRFVPDRSAEVGAALDAASARMRVILDALEARSEGVGLSFDRRPFQGGLDLEHELLPHASRNDADRRMGRVELGGDLRLESERLRLLKQREADGDLELLSRAAYPMNGLLEIPFGETLDPGTQYRLVRLGPADEVVEVWPFFGRAGWEEPLTLDHASHEASPAGLRRVELDRAGLRAALGEVVASPEAADLLARPLYAPTPSFRIAARRVAWSDVVRVLGRTVSDRLRNEEELRCANEGRDPAIDPDDPARVPFRTALEYGRATGTRLPTGMELALAWSLGVVEAEGAGDPGPPESWLYEWTADAASTAGLQFCFRLGACEAARRQGLKPWEADLERLPTGAAPVEMYTATFRVAAGYGEFGD